MSDTKFKIKVTISKMVEHAPDELIQMNEAFVDWFQIDRTVQGDTLRAGVGDEESLSTVELIFRS